MHRAELQRIFFPPTYHDTEPTRRLEHGDNRMWTAMRVFVEFRGGTTLYIPFREASKVLGHSNCLPDKRFETSIRTGNGMVLLTFPDLVRVKRPHSA
jgi:hypothetical protein